MPYLPAALAQLVRSHIAASPAGGADVLLVRGSPEWNLEPLPFGGPRRVELRTARSPLEAWELLAEHADLEGDEFLVIITDVSAQDLGPEILGQVVKQKIYALEPWEAVKAAFGVTWIESRLLNEAWAAEALLDAISGGTRPLGLGTTLSRDTALAYLAARRLFPDGLPSRSNRIDIRALLTWTQQPGALEQFASLRSVERVTLGGWLAETAGPAARALLALVDAGRGGDAVALGVVCSVLWQELPASVPISEPRLRSKLFFTVDPLAQPSYGGAVLRDEDFAAFGLGAADYVAALSAGAEMTTPEGQSVARSRVLRRADQLVTQTGAEEAAAFSPLLRSGLEARYTAVAKALDAAVPSGRRVGTPPTPEAVAVLRLAVDDFERHRLTAEHAIDAERVRMALRLVRWLATPEPEAATVDAAVQTQISDGGWVDRALYRISSGTLENIPALSAAFAKLARAVADRRKARDERFAATLAAWTAAGTEPGSLLTVESFVPRVLAPLKSVQPGFLFILIDGMSAAVAADLGEDLRAAGVWTEYDPMAGSESVGRRRGMAAALPTLTRVSRTSLFTGELADGTQSMEKSRFPALSVWAPTAPLIFHKADLRSDVGAGLSTTVLEAMNIPDRNVAVVLNNVDDLLDDSHDHAKPWAVGDVEKLRDLLNVAASAGRPVVIASDHGHVLDLGSELAPSTISGSGRHRVDEAPAGPGEVELSGPRVVVPGNRIVALWDTDLRYGARKTGYHGGASLAEVVIPVLALLPPGVEVPKGWAPVGRNEPTWSDLGAVDTVASPVASSRDASSAKRATNVSKYQESLLDLAVEAEEGGPTSLIDRLLATELFKQQRQSLPRPQSMPAAKFKKSLTALLEAGGVLPSVAVAAAAGELPTRARGFVTNLRRVLNVDGEAVLSELDLGATVRLDVDKLRVQFELGH